MLVDAFKTGETITISVRPGVYDWLIVMAHTNDGVWDSYLGARSTDVQLDQMAFAANTRYRVIDGQDDIPCLEK